MATTNDVTGDAIFSRANTKAFEDNFDAIFRKNKVVDKKLKVVDDDWNEKRIDIIGSNGPTGEHYNQS